MERVLQAANLDAMPPITPVLCFVDGEWPLLSAPKMYGGVRLESKRCIKKLATESGVLDAVTREHLARTLAMALPAK
ncbi:MAG: hypothetical protein ACREN2_06775 [Candidatus Dormibacteria bacterium]